MKMVNIFYIQKAFYVSQRLINYTKTSFAISFFPAFVPSVYSLIVLLCCIVSDFGDVMQHQVGPKNDGLFKIRRTSSFEATWIKMPKSRTIGSASCVCTTILKHHGMDTIFLL